eukprot:2713875-Amphidinium_carterae.2
MVTISRLQYNQYTHNKQQASYTFVGLHRSKSMESGPLAGFARKMKLNQVPVNPNASIQNVLTLLCPQNSRYLQIRLRSALGTSYKCSSFVSDVVRSRIGSQDHRSKMQFAKLIVHGIAPDVGKEK